MSSHSASTGGSTRSPPSVHCSESQEGPRLQPTPSYIPASGSILHVVSVCINRIGTGYSLLGEGTGSGEFTNREEITTGFNSQVFRDWSVHGSTRRDLKRNKVLNYKFGFVYRCDCLTVTADFARTFASDRDLKPTDTFFVHFAFKNLGEFGTTVSGDDPAAGLRQYDLR